MIKFSDNKDNREYLMINSKVDLGILLASNITPIFVYNEIQQMYFNLYQFESKLPENKIMKNTRADNIAFRKDSLLGIWLLENYDQEKIIYENQFVRYEKVVNALNVALYENNKISEKIMPLFQERVNGSKKELIKQYEEEVIDYILTHDNFYEWINRDEKEPVEYIVFENGEYCKKKLSTGKVLEKK